MTQQAQPERKTHLYTKVATKLIPPISFLRKYNYNCNELCIYHGHIPYKVEKIFPQSLLCYQHTFPTFAWEMPIA
jgi:hypothetical protein